MTQHIPTGSSSSDRYGHHEENQSSNEIRADIDQTRASVGNKIDQLQARLDPNRLKQQAQETVQEMISDTANSMTEYVRTHKDEMVNSLADAARRNPLPTALVGLGVGWLLLEGLSGNRRQSDRYEYERRDFRSYSDQPYSERNSSNRGRFEGSTGRSFVSQGRGQFTEEEYYASPEYYGSAYGRSGYPAPSPQQPYQGERGSEFTSEYNQEFDSEYGKRYGNGHHRNPIAKAADAVKDTLSDVGSEIKDRVEDAGQEIKERVDDMRHEMQDRVSDMRHGVQDQMGSRMEEMRYQQWLMRNQMRGSMEGAEERMAQMRRRARHEGRRRGQQLMRNLEDNPLAYGALALAAGAALAMLLPQTRTENRYFGEMRDEIMDRGQEAMEMARMRAQEVAQEIRPELEEKVRNIASEAKELGKEVVKDAADELRPVMDKAMEKGKQEARNIAQESGIDTDKLMGKFTLNRDTLSGQWKQVRGDIKSKWGQLTDDDLMRVEGDYEKLVGTIQTRYGYTRDRVENEINQFFNNYGSQRSAQASTTPSRS
jgi:uncharacterized protein YjbJ (UPF0337 family)